MIILGENIKQIRELRNYSQSYMAKQLQISQERYSYIETKQKHIPKNVLNKIAELLNVSTELIANFSADTFLSEYDQKFKRKDFS